MMSKNKTHSTAEIPQGALNHGEGKYISKFEYFCVMLSRIGGMFGTTLTGTLAAAFVYELYFGPAGVSADEIKTTIEEWGFNTNTIWTVGTTDGSTPELQMQSSNATASLFIRVATAIKDFITN